MKNKIVKNIWIGCAALMLICSACKRSAPPPTSGTSHRGVRVQVIHDPQTKEALEQIVSAFYAGGHKMQDGRSISVDLQTVSSLRAAREIARGRLKVDGWIAAGPSFVTYLNQSVSGLGSKVGDCNPVFTTPVVGAASKSAQSMLQLENQVLDNFESFIESTHSLEGISFGLGHSVPNASTSGLASLLQLSYLLRGNGTGALEASQLGSEFQSQMRKLENYAFGYGQDDFYLLKQTAHSRGNVARLAFTTEQQVVSFNKQAEQNKRLHALYLKQGSYQLEYHSCLSEADWVTAEKRVALKDFFDYLNSPPAQAIAAQNGFRPVGLGRDSRAEAPLTPEYGVQIAQPEHILPPASKSAIDKVVDIWPEVMRPAAIVLVLDTSWRTDQKFILRAVPAGESAEATPTPTASATPEEEGTASDAFVIAQSHFHAIIDGLSEKDRVALVSFLSRAIVESPFTSDFEAVNEKLDQLENKGGNAIYDALQKAFNLVSQEDLTGYRKTIVLLTDSDDGSSSVPASLLMTQIKNAQMHQDIQLVTIAVVNPGIDYKPLDQVTSLANGIMYKTDMDNLHKVFAEIRNNL